jgi:hypothetical protein
VQQQANAVVERVAEAEGVAAEGFEVAIDRNFAT